MRIVSFVAPIFVGSILLACGAQPMSTAEAERATSEEALAKPASIPPISIPIQLDQTNAKCVAGGGAAQIDVCGANGFCHTAKFSCFPYHCDANAKSCATACAATADCAKGFACQSGTCVQAPVTQCSDMVTSRNNLTGATASCYPYVCDAPTGACLKTCATTADCGNGAVCDVPNKACVVVNY